MVGYIGNQPPLSRSYSSDVLCHFPEQLDHLPFDESAIKTVSHGEGNLERIIVECLFYINNHMYQNEAETF